MDILEKLILYNIKHCLTLLQFVQTRLTYHNYIGQIISCIATYALVVIYNLCDFTRLFQVLILFETKQRIPICVATKTFNEAFPLLMTVPFSFNNFKKL